MLTSNHANFDVPQTGVFAFEIKFKVPTSPLNNGEQLLFFPIGGVGTNAGIQAHASISVYLNRTDTGESTNKLFIGDSNASTILEIPIGNTVDGYQHLGVYYNQSSRQVGYIFNGVNKGYLDSYSQVIKKYGYTLGAVITGFTPTSHNIGKEISIELITDAAKMTQTYPTGTKDICGNTI